MANSFSPERPAVRLSGKEVAGLAARVLSAGFLPSGATGAASEAIEWLELTEGGALRRLDRQKEELLGARWHAPEVVAEAEDAAVVDARGVPAHFHGAVLADWLAAMVQNHGGGAIQAVNVDGPELLAASAYFLAECGISSVVMVAHPDRDACARLTLAGVQGWQMARWPDAETARDLAAAVEALRSLRGRVGALRRITGICRGIAASAARGDAQAFAGPRAPLPIPPGNAVLAAFGPVGGKDMAERFPSAAMEAGFEVLSSRDYAALKTRVLAEGWALDRSLWERLMAFADRALIATSERSRMGAG